MRSTEERKLRRYSRMRNLCRKLNQNRRQLSRKVDLLCSDLVSSNKDLSDTVQQLRHGYDFQAGLIGEYDLQYLLCRSLQHIRGRLAGTSGAIYLCQTGMVEAHLTGMSTVEEPDPDVIEPVLYKTVIRHVIRDGKARLVANINGGASDGQESSIPPLSILAVPLIDQTEVLGAMVFYRGGKKQFSEDDRCRIHPYVAPLSRAIAGLQKLGSYIESQKS